MVKLIVFYYSHFLESKDKDKLDDVMVYIT